MSRVRDLGEVYTNEREVNAMLDLLPASIWRSIEATFLEPACGNGNFLVAILTRKLALIPKGMTEAQAQDKIEFLILRAATSLYGIDICGENVAESRKRLQQTILDHWPLTLNNLEPSPRFLPLLARILEANIRQGNTLQPETVEITEWATPSEGTFKPKVYLLIDLEHDAHVPIREDRLIIYYKDKDKE